MPRICEFYGIVIYMYRPDHPPAHIHARYGDFEAQVSINDGSILNGTLPVRAERMVREWILLRQAELREHWRLAQELEPLVAIDPLP